jgi:hypothetical protein
MIVLRSAVAIALGFAFLLTFAGLVAPVLGALAGVAGFLAANGMASIIAGWLAARIAGRAAFLHAVGLAVLIGIGTVVVVSGPLPEHQPRWYVPLAGVVGVAGVLFGGWLRSAAAGAARP